MLNGAAAQVAALPPVGKAKGNALVLFGSQTGRAEEVRRFARHAVGHVRRRGRRIVSGLKADEDGERTRLTTRAQQSLALCLHGGLGTPAQSRCQRPQRRNRQCICASSLGPGL